MDPSVVHQLFVNTLHSDLNLRQQAEAQLRQLDSSPDMLRCVLHLISHADTQTDVKLAATIYFKNRVRRAWDPYDASEVVLISEEDRVIVKSSILEVMSRSTEHIRSIFTSAISTILMKDYPKKWPEFLPTATQLVNSDDLNLTHCGLLALHELFRIKQWKSFKKDSDMSNLIDSVFPRLNAMGASLVNQDTNEAAVMIHLIFKIYRKSIHSGLVKSQQEPSTLISWGTLFTQVIEKSLPNKVLPEDSTERENLPWIRAKKWAYHCLNGLFERYGNPANMDKSNKYYKFANKFVTHFAPNVLKVYMTQVDLSISNQSWMSRKCTFLTSTFFSECITHKITWKLFQPHVEKIITQFLFPQLCYNIEDEEEFEDNPSEFLHRRLMDSIDKVMDSEAAIELLSSLVDMRKKATFDGILGFAHSIMVACQNAPANPESDKKKDGAMSLIESISEVVLQSDNTTRSKMAQFLSQHLLQELQSANPLLRFRACSLVRVYADLDLPEAMITQMFQLAYQNLGDSQIVIRVGAALALEALLQYDYLMPVVIPTLPTIIEQLLLLTNQIDIENLAQVLETFVETYPTELAPYSIQLCESLTNTFFRLVNEISKAPDDPTATDDELIDDKVYTAMGILKTIGTIIISLDDSPDTVIHLEGIILPAIRVIFEREIADVYEETFEVIDCCIYSLRAVSQSMWELFDHLYNLAMSDDTLCLGEYCTTFDNFVGFGHERFAADPTLQVKLFALFQKTMTRPESDTTDMIHTCKMMMSLMLHLNSKAQQLIQPILSITFPYIIDPTKAGNRSLMGNVLKLTVACLMADIPTSLSIMEQNNWTTGFFSFWFSKLDAFAGVHDKKLSITCLCNILSTSPHQLPDSIKQGWSHLLIAMVENFKTLPDAIEKHKEALRRVGEDSDEEDDDEEGGDDNEDEEDDDEDDSKPSIDLEEGGASDQTDSSDESDGSDQNSSDYTEEEIFDSDLARSPLSNIDVYQLFQSVFHNMETNQPDGFQLLISGLNEEQQGLVKKVLDTAVLQQQQQQQQQLLEGGAGN